MIEMICRRKKSNGLENTVKNIESGSSRNISLDFNKLNIEISKFCIERSKQNQR